MLPEDWTQVYADAAVNHGDDNDSLDSTSELLAAVRGTAFEVLFAGEVTA